MNGGNTHKQPHAKHTNHRCTDGSFGIAGSSKFNVDSRSSRTYDFIPHHAHNRLLYPFPFLTCLLRNSMLGFPNTPLVYDSIIFMDFAHIPHVFHHFTYHHRYHHCHCCRSTFFTLIELGYIWTWYGLCPWGGN